MRSEVNYIYEDDLAFRAPGSAAVTATGSIGEVALDKMVNAREGDQKNLLGAEGYAVVIVVEALDQVDTDETYEFSAVVGPTGLGSSVTVGATAVVSTGQYVLKLDAASLEKLSSDREALGLTLTVGGTTPSITFSAWLAYDDQI